MEKAIGLDAIDLEDVEELEEDPGLSAKTKDELIEARKQILEQVYALRRMRKDELTKGEPDSSAKEDYEKKIGELAKGMVQVERWLLLKEIEALQQQLVAKRLQLNKSEVSLKRVFDRSPRNGWIRLHEELSFSFKAASQSVSTLLRTWRRRGK